MGEIKVKIILLFLLIPLLNAQVVKLFGKEHFYELNVNQVTPLTFFY